MANAPEIFFGVREVHRIYSVHEGVEQRQPRYLTGMLVAPTDEEFEHLADLCRQAHEAVLEFGTQEMLAFTTALLHALGKEAARRTTDKENGHAE